MTDTTEKLPTELVGDLDAPQPTSTEADLVRGGWAVTAAVIQYATVNGGGNNDPAQMFQQIMQQMTQG